MKNPVKNLITWSTSHLITSQKSAFTLAEVLITLAIIGVVAAMTIPTLVANYQSKSWNTASQVFERKLQEALKVMNVQQTLSGYTTTEDFVEELSKHFKITKICDNNELSKCFSDTISMRDSGKIVDLSGVKTASDLGQDEWGTNVVGVQFGNGTTGLIAYNPSCSQDPYSNLITGADCLAIVYDTTGHKTPNHLSKDLRINANVNSIAGVGLCSFEIGGVCFSGMFQAGYLAGADCEAQLNYTGIESCALVGVHGSIDFGEGRDYYVASAKACKDKGGRLPDSTELVKLANKLYGDNFSSTAYSCPNDEECRDNEFANELGATLNSSGQFAVFSSEARSATEDAYIMIFNKTGTAYGLGMRDNSLYSTICAFD